MKDPRSSPLASSLPRLPRLPRSPRGIHVSDSVAYSTGVAPGDGTGVAPEDRTGVKFTSVTACPVEFPVGNPIQQGGRISLGRHALCALLYAPCAMLVTPLGMAPRNAYPACPRVPCEMPLRYYFTGEGQNDRTEACPVGSENRTGVESFLFLSRSMRHACPVKFTLVTACQVKFM